MNNLFENGKLIDTELRQSDRPLGELSDFVVTKMPSFLGGVRMGTHSIDGLIDASEHLVKKDGYGHLPAILGNAGARDLASLDVKMIEAAIVNSGGSCGKHLTEFVDVLVSATGMLPGITYEDLIFINPLQTDPRLFTDGLVGRSERDFYLGHRILEEYLTKTVEQCANAIKTLIAHGPDGISEATSFIEGAVKSFVPVISYTGRIGMRMPKDHFEIFRKYLVGNAQRRIFGPSGKYTSGIPTLDFLLGGATIEGEYSKLNEELDYYPRKGRDDIQGARHIAKNGQSLVTLAHQLGVPSELLDEIQTMSESIRKFRRVHLRDVEHQIPQALMGNAGGTGGESDVKAFLRGREAIDHLKKGQE